MIVDIAVPALGKSHELRAKDCPDLQTAVQVDGETPSGTDPPDTEMPSPSQCMTAPHIPRAPRRPLVAPTGSTAPTTLTSSAPGPPGEIQLHMQIGLANGAQSGIVYLCRRNQ